MAYSHLKLRYARFLFLIYANATKKTFAPAVADEQSQFGYF
jgi:hypothetical protein